jgi:hypothetical protein
MIVGIAVASAGPHAVAGPFTFMAMALPLYLLYEGCIVIARTRERAPAAGPPRAGRRRSRAVRRRDSYVEDRPSELWTASGAPGRPGPAVPVTGT